MDKNKGGGAGGGGHPSAFNGDVNKDQDSAARAFDAMAKVVQHKKDVSAFTLIDLL